jgi:predicted methyltransferase
MRSTLLVALVAGLLAAPAAFALSQPEPTAAAISAAIADPARPAEDVARDATRHPQELLAFAGVQEGGVVVDWIPGGGYFTRLFSGVVGAGGTVHAWVPQEIEGNYDLGKLARAMAAERPNVKATIEPLLATTSITNADIVWTSQNYHDLYADFMGKPDVAAFNKQVFNMLKPGGVYVIVDHAAVPGAPAETGETLHRIDPALVKKEVEAAGFVFEEESKVLANPDDAHDLVVFDEKIRGKTDQFVYKFRKPAA